MAEDSFRRRRRQVGSATPPSMTTITLEFGDPPDVNISQPTAPSVAMEIEMAGEVNDSVDIEVSIHPLPPSLPTQPTSFTHSPSPFPPKVELEPTNQTLSENPLNQDPPQSLSEYIAALNASVMEYVDMVEVYQLQANLTMAANEIGEAVVNAVSQLHSGDYMFPFLVSILPCHIILYYHVDTYFFIF